mgnify:CR=1 FL=1
MDSNNFKKLFGNLLGKKRNISTKNENEIEEENKNEKENSKNISQGNTNVKKYVKYGDIINQKIKENTKNEEILKNFDEEENHHDSIIVKTAELIKQKNKKFEEDKEKLKNSENLDKDKGKLNNDNKNCNEDDSVDSEYGSEKEFRENITSIPKEFHIDICNREWNLNIDTKK